MTVFTTWRARMMLASIGIGALVALSACAPTPQASSSPSPSPSPSTASPEPYAGPIVFVGDELDAFSLTPEEIVGIVPEATDVGDPSPVLEQVSDGGSLLRIRRSAMPSTPSSRSAAWGRERSNGRCRRIPPTGSAG